MVELRKNVLESRNESKAENDEKRKELNRQVRDLFSEFRTKQYNNKENKKIEFYKIESFSDNPFRLYNEEKLEELIESIKDDGLISPILLWKMKITLY